MDKNSIDDVLKANKGRFYVYQLSKPDDTPFYVGKGSGRRVFHHEAEALGPTKSHKLNIIRQLKRRGDSIHYMIIGFFDCERECHEREMAEILRIGRYDLKTGPLANLTDGGEGTVGLSDETRVRIDFNLHSVKAPGDRGIANRFFAELVASVRSVPIRPVNGTAKPRALGPVERTSRLPTARQAAALAASAIANRVMIEPGAVLPRRMSVAGAPMIIEFGACKDILQSGMADLALAAPPALEALVLTALGVAAISRHIDSRLLVSAGILMPPFCPAA